MSSHIPSNAIRIGATILSALVALPAIAATAGPLPPEQRQNAVSFRTGGVGQGEAEAMKRAAGQYPLEVEFVQRQDGQAAYLAGVKVSIENHGGRQILGTTTDGPFLLAKLPAGRYTIVADNGNVERQRDVTIPTHGTRRVLMTW